MSNREQDIISLVAGILEIPANKLTLQTGVGDIPEWDSLAQVAIMTTLEEEYDLNLDPDLLMEAATIKDLVALVEGESLGTAEPTYVPITSSTEKDIFETIVEKIFKHAAQTPAATAIIFPRFSLTYYQLADNISAACSWLKSQSVRKGSIVALGASRCPEFIACYFAAHALGAIVLNLDTETNADRLTQLFEKTQPTLVIGLSNGKCRSYTEVDLTIPGEISIAASPDMVADLMFTTGTTGEPKGVPLTHSNLVAAATQINSFIGNNKNDVEVLALPICHSFGMGRLRCVLSAGGTVILTPGFSNSKYLLNVLKSYKATGFSFVPAAWAYLRQMSGDKLAECSPYLRYIEIGSAPMPEQERRHLMSLFPQTRICMHYGLTEASRSTFIEFHQHQEHLSSAGKPTPGVQIKIFSPHGEELSANEEGEICIKGAHVMRRYWESSNLDGYFGDFFRSGDWGRLDDNGFLYILSRTKDIINTGGKKVSPEEVESVLVTVPGIVECACIPVPDPNGLLGEVIKAVLVSDNSSSIPSETELRKIVSQRLENYKCPAIYEWRETALPKTESGKLQRHLIS